MRIETNNAMNDGQGQTMDTTINGMQIRQIEDPEGRGHDAYEVISTSGKTYTVRYEGSGDADPDYAAVWSCTCPAARYRSGLCKHVRAVVQATEAAEAVA